MSPTYIGDIELNEETLTHFGVKGMKWGKRKARLKGKTLELRAKMLRKLHGIKDPSQATLNIKKKQKIYGLENDDGRNTSTTRPTGNLYKKNSFGYVNNGYSSKSIEKNFKYSPSSSEEETNRNYKKDINGKLHYTKKLYPTKSGGKTNTSGQTTKWEPRTNEERQAKQPSNIKKIKNKKTSPSKQSYNPVDKENYYERAFGNRNKYGHPATAKKMSGNKENQSIAKTNEERRAMATAYGNNHLASVKSNKEMINANGNIYDIDWEKRKKKK